MNHQYIEYVETKQHIRPFEHNDKFQFRKDKKYHRLQKILFWILNKIGAYARDEEITFTKHTIDTNNVIDALLKQDDNLIEFYHQHGERLLIGSRNFSKLMNTPEINQKLSFRANYYYSATIGIGQVFGLNITIIPWMEGMLVIPKGII